MSAPSLLAQSSDSKQVDHQDILWFKYYNILTISNNYQLHTEIETRRFIGDFREHQWVLPRIQVQRRLGNQANIGVGAAYFLQAMPQTENAPVDRIRTEVRPHQDLNVNQEFKHLKLSHRYRIEERFFLANARDDAAFNMRFRYKAQVNIPLNKEGLRPLSVKVYDEVMVNAGGDVGQNVFDQNRIYAGLIWKISSAISLETGYMNWFQQRPSGKEFYARNLFGLTLIHTLELNQS